MTFRPTAPAAACSAALLLLAAPKAACAAGGPYLSVHGGPTYLQDEDLDAAGGGRIEPEYEFGYHLGGAAGYAFGPVRVEGEVAYQRSEVHGGDSTGLAGAVAADDLRGHAAITSFLVNAYDVADLGDQLRPFVGAGVGAARVSLRNTAAVAVGGGAAARAEVVDDDDTVPAAQALVGLSFDVDEHWTTAFSYRFFAAFGAEFDATAPLAGAAEGDFFSHALRFEARYRF